MKTQIPLIVGKSNQKTQSHLSTIVQDKDYKHNVNWMQDWMEQSDNYKNNPKVMALIANNVEGFLHYSDIVEGKNK